MVTPANTVSEKYCGITVTVQSATPPKSTSSPIQTSCLHDYPTASACRRFPLADGGSFFGCDPLLPPNHASCSPTSRRENCSEILSESGEGSIRQGWGLHDIEVGAPNLFLSPQYNNWNYDTAWKLGRAMLVNFISPHHYMTHGR